MSSTYAPNSLDDPQFIPGETIGTGHGEPVLISPEPPSEILKEFGELIEETFESGPEMAFLMLVAVIITVALVAVGLLAVMSTIRIQKMTGGHGRDDKEVISAYLARNKVAYDQIDDSEDESLLN